MVALYFVESIRSIEYNIISSEYTFLGGKEMDYLTSAECAEKWNVSQRWVAIYCKEGRIKGAIQRRRMWFIPADTAKPIDPRNVRKMAHNNILTS